MMSVAAFCRKTILNGRHIMGKFVMKETASGFRFNLKAGNGETIAVSETYTSEAACKNGIASVQKNAPEAAVEDPKFEVYLDKAGEYRFRLKATNGQIIATGESYKAKAGVLNVIESIQKNAPDAKIVEE